jgi:hypothetical protein
LASPPAEGVTMIVYSLLVQCALASDAPFRTALVVPECNLSRCQAYSQGCVSQRVLYVIKINLTAAVRTQLHPLSWRINTFSHGCMSVCSLSHTNACWTRSSPGLQKVVGKGLDSRDL